MHFTQIERYCFDIYRAFRSSPLTCSSFPLPSPDHILLLLSSLRQSVSPQVKLPSSHQVAHYFPQQLATSSYYYLQPRVTGALRIIYGRICVCVCVFTLTLFPPKSILFGSLWQNFLFENPSPFLSAPSLPLSEPSDHQSSLTSTSAPHSDSLTSNNT